MIMFQREGADKLLKAGADVNALNSLGSALRWSA